MHAIEAQQLVRKFGAFVAVGGVGFEVHQGEVFGFLGPNGAPPGLVRWSGCGIRLQPDWSACLRSRSGQGRRTPTEGAERTGYTSGTSAFKSASKTKIMPIWSTDFRHNRHPHAHEDSAGALSAC